MHAPLLVRIVRKVIALVGLISFIGGRQHGIDNHITSLLWEKVK
jgi:hypothetical protein